MSKLSKIVILVFLILAISIGAFAISRFSNAQNSEDSVFATQTSGSNSENPEGFTSSTEGTAYVCPHATSLEEINPRCPGIVILELGETINGMTLTTTTYDDKEYYLVLGFENGGAGVYSEKADLSTQIAITQMEYGEIDILATTTQQIGDGKSPLLLSELKGATIDLEDYTLSGKINHGQTRNLKMKFKFLETAGNEYQGKSIIGKMGSTLFLCVFLFLCGAEKN